MMTILDYMGKQLTLENTESLPEVILSTPQDTLSSVFHQCLELILAVPMQCRMYKQSLKYLLDSQSLKYTMLFVQEKLMSEMENKLGLLLYCSEYLLMPRVQLHKQGILTCYQCGIASIDCLSQMETQIVQEFFLATLNNLLKARTATNITVSTVISVLDLLCKVAVEDKQLVDEHMALVVEVAESYEMSLDDTLKSVDYRIAKLPLSYSCYKWVTSPEKQLQDQMRLTLRYSDTEYLEGSLRRLCEYLLPTLQFRGIDLVSYFAKVVFLIGTSHQLKQQSKELIHLVSQIQLSEPLKRELWLQITLAAQDFNFKAYALSQYKQHSRLSIGHQVPVDLEMMVQQIDTMSQDKVGYLLELANFMYVASKKHDILWMVLTLRNLKVIGEVSGFEVELIHDIFDRIVKQQPVA